MLGSAGVGEAGSTKEPSRIGVVAGGRQTGPGRGCQTVKPPRPYSVQNVATCKQPKAPRPPAVQDPPGAVGNPFGCVRILQRREAWISLTLARK